MTDRMAAEVFHPGEFLNEELEARGWSQADLAAILGCTTRLVSEVTTGKRSVTPSTARGLGAALGTGAQFWLNLESAYQLYRLSRLNQDNGLVEKRARIFTRAPVREMIRRAWIEESENVEVLEQRVLEFYRIKTLDQEPNVWTHAARKSTDYSELTPPQWAWLCRARQLATAIDCKRFTQPRFDRALAHLRPLLSSAQEVRHIPTILAESGIRLVVVEHLKGTKIDGACFWLNATSPVVALSVRYNRIDGVWHTLMHELGHLKNRDGLKDDSRPLDVDLLGSRALPATERPENEVNADRFATEFLIDQDELNDFISRVGPLYSKLAIRGFANLLGVHPGIVIGQLQHRKEIPWTHSREMLVRVREILTPATLTDGWGHMAPVLS